MKNHVLWAVGLAMAVGAGAQQPRHVLDQAVASELLRGAVAPQTTVGALQQSADFQRAYLLSVVEQELVQEAARRGLAERVDVQRALMQARYQILLQALREDVARGATQPTDADLQTAFKKDKERWVLQEAVKADIFAVDSGATNALDTVRGMVAAQKIDTNKLVAVNARALASASADQWIAENQIVPEVWKGVKEMKKDQIQFFRVQGMYWVVRRDDQRESKPMTFDQAKEPIRQELLGQRQQERWNTFVADKQKAIGLQ